MRIARYAALKSDDSQHRAEKDDDDYTTLVYRPFSGTTRVISRYQNVSILDFIGAQDDGGGGANWSYKTRKAPVKSSPSTN